MKYFINIPVKKATVSGYFYADNEKDALAQAEHVFDGLLGLQDECEIEGGVVEIASLDMKNASIDNA